MKGKYYNTCCNPNYTPIPVAQFPTASPRSKYPKGPYPGCDLCKTGAYPGKPNTVTAVLGIPGNPTCKDLYYMGLQGSISDQLCAPMQYSFASACGCPVAPSSTQAPPLSSPSKPTPTKPTPTKPTPTKPSPTKPSPTKPSPTKPSPTKPAAGMRRNLD